MTYLVKQKSSFKVHKRLLISSYVTSWMETRTIVTEKSNLIMLFDKYIPICLENMRTRFKKITPIAETAHVEMLCHLLDCLLVPKNTPQDCPKEWYELYFVFGCIWAFGSAMFQEQVTGNYCTYVYTNYQVFRQRIIVLNLRNGG